MYVLPTTCAVYIYIPVRIAQNSENKQFFYFFTFCVRSRFSLWTVHYTRTRTFRSIFSIIFIHDRESPSLLSRRPIEYNTHGSVQHAHIVRRVRRTHAHTQERAAITTFVYNNIAFVVLPRRYDDIRSPVQRRSAAAGATAAR